MIIYEELQDAVIDPLVKIIYWADKNISASANQLLITVNNCEFQFLVQILSTLFAVSLSLPLSKLLQTPELDLSLIVSMTGNTIKVFKQIRVGIKQVFQIILQRVKTFCDNSDINISLPR